VPREPFVPPSLVDRPFRGTAVVRDGILTSAQLRSRAWTRLLRDVYVVRGLEDDDGVRREALRLVMDPTTVACGLTAAWLHGAWEPAPGSVVPLQVTRPVRSPGNQPDGLHRRRLVLRGTPDLLRPPVGVSELYRDVVEFDGLRTTSLVRTCFDLMRQRHLVEAVAVADAFAYRCGLPLSLLGLYCQDRRRWPFVRPTRTAVGLAVDGARSPGESRLRMMVVLSGFPEPWVNVPVCDRSGDHVATPDLLMTSRRWLGLEYDGGYHDEGPQPVADRARDRRITTELGFPVLHYDARGIVEERRLVAGTISRLTGLRPRYPLEDRDFLRLARF
jgi:hypothetical protein